MKELEKKAVKIFQIYGTVVVFTAYGESKILHSLKDIKSCFKLAKNGVIDEIVNVR